ncbi:helix-turn-helix domain-containing protein [Brucella intermedia]|uniref:helix-turn-helix domain-containing protein n=1 Tax=Brucella intermedia TaxID=94625 RepID=UPI00124C7D2B|nr:helix-turn-helix domain-containing protein [Brucella intermedia]KAB2716914.1 helix-turn-helix domain-containing protein [Brucella intermedia]
MTEAMSTLRISRSTFYKLIQSGKIAAFKVGRRTLVAETELHRFLEDQVIEAAERRRRRSAR